MQTELDRIANQNHLQLLKALIPHLPSSNRKRFSVLIKIMEVQNVIRFYNNPHADIRSNSAFTSDTSENQSVKDSCEYSDSAAEESPPDLLDILTDVRCYCEGEEQQMIDQALQMMSMIELFSVMAQSEASPEDNSDCDPNAPPAGSDAYESDASLSESSCC